MLADRGQCSFVTKVRNMEKAGAAVGIVIDSSNEDISKVVMSDDGTGAGIRIPSLLISKKDGVVLMDFLETASKEELDQLVIMANFEMGRPDNRVEYDIWYSSSDQKMLDFIEDFQLLDQKFDNSVLMTPHFRFWECLDCEQSYTDINCFANGKYCGHDARNLDLKGRDIILEDLRQLCVYKRAYEGNDNHRNIWWDYLKEYHSLCYGSVSEECSRGAHTMINLNFDTTQQCVQSAF